jgi:hypothetical protein
LSGFLPVLSAVLRSNSKQEAAFDIMVPGKGITLVDALQETCRDGVSRAAFQNLSRRRGRAGRPGPCAASETASISSDSASASTNSSSDGSISSDRSRTSPTRVIACQILSKRPSFCSLSIGMIITPISGGLRAVNSTSESLLYLRCRGARESKRHQNMYYDSFIQIQINFTEDPSIITNTPRWPGRCFPRSSASSQGRAKRLRDALTGGTYRGLVGLRLKQLHFSDLSPVND